MKLRRLGTWLAAVLLALGLLAAAAIWALNLRGEAPVDGSGTAGADAAQIARGAYLARLGNCVSCHTRAGGAPYAGGRAIATPFGAVYASNLTPDVQTGLGGWSPDAFWRALHHGRSADGRLLYPAFPYPAYTHITHADADALFSYLQSLAPVHQATPAPTLRFPYNTQAALAVWRALYFRPAPERPAPQTPLQRGAYIAQALGHCAACHSPRDALGGPLRGEALSGAIVPGEYWWAPSLHSPAQAGVADWSEQDIATLLTSGRSAQAGVSGPMAEVVFHSLQYLTADDALALARWLRALPQHAPAAGPSAPAAAAQVLERGAKLYADYCAECHQDEGQGKRGAFPALAGNRAVTMAEPLNLIQITLHGGYLPATAGNPRPHGMPPFRQSMTDADIAAVLSYIRQAWGNQAGRVDAIAVHRVRERSTY
ncbi:cytochrome c [Comamonas sp. NLF-1-9]|uniref:cytochrome c n=1 Tax=Comamonas sp. NLF-1-9 TaxID=2853163 RepID=UPI001C470966|nr:cytochrome c [Comamonas sp. NLF-1-9]QXL85253.1 cytochrome c [Comamonas sp. NLF-1-9]